MISFSLFTTSYTTIYYYYYMYEPAGLAGVTCSLSFFSLLFFFSPLPLQSLSLPLSLPITVVVQLAYPVSYLSPSILSIYSIYSLFGYFCLKLTLPRLHYSPSFQRIHCHPLAMSADLTKVDSAIAGLSTSPTDEKPPISDTKPTHRRKSSVAEGVWNIKDLGRVHALSSWDRC